jgi:PAS domain S-box-containing protein
LKATAPRDYEEPAPTGRLSPRQRQVLDGILAGKPNKVIAHGLGLSTRTVEAHRAAIMSKIGVSSVVELVQLTSSSGHNRDHLEIVAKAYPGLVSFWDRDLIGRFAHAPRAGAYAKQADAIVGRSIKDVLGPYLFNLSAPYIRAALRGEYQQFRQILRRPNGSLAIYCTNYTPNFDARGEVDGFFAFTMDITAFNDEVMQTEPEADKPSSQAEMVMDGGAAILSVNGAFTEVTQYRAEEVVGRTPIVIKPAGIDPSAYMQFWHKMFAERFWQGTVWYRRHDGYLFRCRQTVTVEGDTSDLVRGYVSFSEFTIPSIHAGV